MSNKKVRKNKTKIKDDGLVSTKVLIILIIIVIVLIATT